MGPLVIHMPSLGSLGSSVDYIQVSKFEIIKISGKLKRNFKLHFAARVLIKQELTIFQQSLRAQWTL